jgi:hypothetical protein
MDIVRGMGMDTAEIMGGDEILDDEMLHISDTSVLAQHIRIVDIRCSLAAARGNELVWESVAQGGFRQRCPRLEAIQTRDRMGPCVCVMACVWVGGDGCVCHGVCVCVMACVWVGGGGCVCHGVCAHVQLPVAPPACREKKRLRSASIGLF